MLISRRWWGALCVLAAFCMALPGAGGAGATLVPNGPAALQKAPGYGAPALDLEPLAGSLPEFPTNLTHFVYVIRENHVFDDYLGDCALDINDTCDGGQGWTSPTCSTPPCTGDPAKETAASGDQLDVPYLHTLARQYAVFDNYYSSVDPYSAQAHAYFFSADATISGQASGCSTVVEGTGSNTEWGTYNNSNVQGGSCGNSGDTGSQIYPSSGTIFDRFTSSHVATPTGTTPPFLTIGDILWELSSPGCTHDSFGAIAGGLPGNSEAIDYVTCTSGNGWWTNTTNGQITEPPVINPVTHTPEMLDICQYECDDIATYPDEWAANDFISYVKDYGLPTYTFIELFDDHPGDNCGAATQADCIKYNDESMDRIVTSIENGSSPYRNNTVIAIQEDDTQDGANGADHVNNGRRIPMVIVAPPNVEKTGNPNPASCGIPTTGLTYDQCGNVVHETYNTSNVLAVMERVEMNVNPSIYSASITSTTFPMVQNDQLAMVNPLEALWKCNDPQTQPYCNTGVSTGGNFLTNTAISPNPISTSTSGTASLTATSYDNGTAFSGPTYLWTVTPSALGSVSPATGASVTFTGGSSNGNGRVCVNATYNTYQLAMQCAITTVSSTLALASVAVSPSSVPVSAGGTSPSIRGSATLNTGSQIYPGTSGSTWTWTLSSTTDGSLNATTGAVVDFVALGNWGNTTACLNVTWGTPSVTKTGCTWISISKAPPALATVSLTPSTVALVEGATQLFQVTPYNQYGQVMYGPPLGFNFTASPSSLGTFAPATQGSWKAFSNFTAGTTAQSGTITVTVTDGVNIPHSATASVSVSATAPLTAVFTQTPWHGNAPLSVTISGTVSGGSGSGYTQTMNWGDGTTSSVGTGATINLPHTYSTKGSFTPTLSLTDSAGDSAQVSLGAISVYANNTATAVKAFASASSTSGTVPFTVTLTGSASGGTGSYTYQWNFGDGTPTTPGQVVQHTYTTSGAFFPTLWVNDSAGETGTYPLALYATPASTPSSLSLIAWASPRNGTAPLNVSAGVTPSGGVAPYDFNWNWGDGAQSTSQDPVYVYTSPGTYQAELTVTDFNGKTGHVFFNFTVVAPPSSVVSSSPSSGGLSTAELALLAAVIILLGICAFLVVTRNRKPKGGMEEYPNSDASGTAYAATPVAVGPPPGSVRPGAPAAGLPPASRPGYNPADDERAPDPRAFR